MDRIFKRPFLWPGAISQDRERCQFLFHVVRKPMLNLAARPESGREVPRKVSCHPSREFRASGAAGLRWQADLIAQIVWNRSTRRAGERGGARVDRPRWLVLRNLIEPSPWCNVTPSSIDTASSKQNAHEA